MTTPKQSKALLIEFEVFSNYAIRVEFADDLVKAAKRHKDIADFVSEEEDADADAMTLYDGSMMSYIFLRPGRTYGTVAHEALHAINYMMKKLGVKEDKRSEVTAYHLGFVVDNIVSFRQRQTRGNHGKTKHSHRGKKLRSR